MASERASSKFAMIAIISASIAIFLTTTLVVKKRQESGGEQNAVRYDRNAANLHILERKIVGAGESAPANYHTVDYQIAEADAIAIMGNPDFKLTSGAGDVVAPGPGEKYYLFWKTASTRSEGVLITNDGRIRGSDVGSVIIKLSETGHD
jgi:hypothetical protein